jgi:hypothetical protein
MRERFGAIERQCVPEFESDDPMVALNAAAQVTLQRRRDAHRARVEGEVNRRGLDVTLANNRPLRGDHA